MAERNGVSWLIGSSTRHPVCRVRRWGLLCGTLLGLIAAGCPGGDPQPRPQTAPQIVAQLVQEGYLKASNIGAGIGDWSGYSIALAGDTLVVGAPFESGTATGINGAQTDGAFASGAVYVFTRDPVTRVWSQGLCESFEHRSRGSFRFQHCAGWRHARRGSAL